MDPSRSPAEPRRELIARLARYSTSGPLELGRLCEIAQDVARRDVAGEIVECGVRNGGSAAVLALGLPGRRLWLYDSFEGLPPPAVIDGPAARGWTGRCRGDEALVREALELAGAGQVVVRRGWFEQTLGDAMAETPTTIALLHVDADWYASITAALERFYDAVTDGGAVILDDFGHWEGCREAFYDFCARRRLKPLLERYGHSQAWWVKGRAHNRESLGRWDMP